MYIIKSLDTKRHTFYYGYVSKYERSEAEKADRRYFIKQKLLGFSFATLFLSPVIYYKEPKILLLTGIFILFGLIVAFTDQRITG